MPAQCEIGAASSEWSCRPAVSTLKKWHATMLSKLRSDSVTPFCAPALRRRMEQTTHAVVSAVERRLERSSTTSSKVLGRTGSQCDSDRGPRHRQRIFVA